EELRAHGAPAPLLAQVARAARDEVRHARATARLARRYGGHPQRPAIAPPRLRSLEAIALENAVEGGVNETYAALEAQWLAEHAQDPEIARTMGAIALDEARHAALSWQVAAWVDAQLRPAARARVKQARQQAVERLRAAACQEPAAEL